MILLDDKCLVHGFWFVACDDFDWLAVVIRPEAGKPWEAVYRFRYHVDDKIFDSDDVKSGYKITTSDHGEKAPLRLIAAIEMAFMLTEMRANARGRFLPVDGNGEKAAEVLAGSGFAHVRSEGSA